MAKWYAIKDGVQIGPFEEHQLPNVGITPSTMVWCQGMSDWAPAASVPELSSLFVSSTPPPPPHDEQGSQHQTNVPPYRQPYAPEQKSKIAAGLFAIFLGWLGLQYFYLGKIGAGFVTILLCIVTCGLWNIVLFIQGIIMLTLDDYQFQRKYVDNPAFMPLF